MAVLHDEEGEKWVNQKVREKRLNTGTEGVHAVMPFQCEICWMRNLENRNPCRLLDGLYVKCIRRASLDLMAGKAASTVKSHVGRIRETLKYCREIRRTPHFAPRGPMPLGDPLGMGLAVDMLMKSIRSKGRIKWHVQFDTMRAVRATFTKTWASSPLGATEGATFAGNSSRIRFTSCPSQSEWFGDYLTGAEDRMGFDTTNQLYLPIKVVIRQLELVKRDADREELDWWLCSLQVWCFPVYSDGCLLEGTRRLLHRLSRY